MGGSGDGGEGEGVDGGDAAVVGKSGTTQTFLNDNFAKYLHIIEQFGEPRHSIPPEQARTYSCESFSFAKVDGW